MRYALSDIIERLNYLGTLPEKQLEELREVCSRLGHVPTGERFCTIPPIWTCYDCGTRFKQEER